MTIFKRCVIVLILCLGGLLAACSPSTLMAGEPSTWIDVPINGLEVQPGQPVQIEGHAAHPAGVGRVEFWFDGVLGATQDDPPAEGSLVYFAQSWTPPGPGDHTIQVVAIGTDGSGSQPDSVRIHVGGQVAEVTQAPTATPTIGLPEIGPSPTPTTPPPVIIAPTFTPTIPPPPGAVIQFWSDAEEVGAGSCTTLHWHVENAQAVAYDGAPVGADGTQSVCPCAEESHTLTVTGLNGFQEQRIVTVRASGVCVTPFIAVPFVPDTEPPAAPVQLKPTNGQEFSCVPGLMLRWGEVSDASGIAEYRVQVERHAGDNNWQPAPNASQNGLTSPELELKTAPPKTLSCGWMYRWRVLAVDTAGNVGPWSGWFLFSLPLG